MKADLDETLAKNFFLHDISRVTMLGGGLPPTVINCTMIDMERSRRQILYNGDVSCHAFDKISFAGLSDFGVPFLQFKSGNILALLPTLNSGFSNDNLSYVCRRPDELNQRLTELNNGLPHQSSVRRWTNVGDLGLLDSKQSEKNTIQRLIATCSNDNSNSTAFPTFYNLFDVKKGFMEVRRTCLKGKVWSDVSDIVNGTNTIQIPILLNGYIRWSGENNNNASREFLIFANSISMTLEDDSNCSGGGGANIIVDRNGRIDRGDALIWTLSTQQQVLQNMETDFSAFDIFKGSRGLHPLGDGHDQQDDTGTENVESLLDKLKNATDKIGLDIFRLRVMQSSVTSVIQTVRNYFSENAITSLAKKVLTNETRNSTLQEITNLLKEELQLRNQVKLFMEMNNSEELIENPVERKRNRLE